MEIKLTGAETGDQLIKQLVYLRQCARRLLNAQNMERGNRASLKKMIEDEAVAGTSLEAEVRKVLAGVEGRLVDLEFAIIEIGQYLVHLGPELDKKVSREALFDAINTNHADRDTESVRKHGSKASHILFVLNLENSATKDDDVVIRPLNWCHQMAFMHELQTNPKLDRIVHDEANEFFNGAFGEYRERPLMERLAGRAM
ncbi:hypothetical protein [Alicycliphilus denitrificans]|uniref:Uncharacterized protein n=1 Tax=Alicycliphilus denitrificans TaxID=179636 RepID=A0A420KBR1_9BURK|nr:hypothetical protein [Alicycliphilus denitrificans]RKJ96657.1 hypothetical protein CE154_011590 [Alicycliphilus denitrificans]